MCSISSKGPDNSAPIDPASRYSGRGGGVAPELAEGALLLTGSIENGRLDRPRLDGLDQGNCSADGRPGELKDPTENLATRATVPLIVIDEFVPFDTYPVKPPVGRTLGAQRLTLLGR